MTLVVTSTTLVQILISKCKLALGGGEKTLIGGGNSFKKFLISSLGQAKNKVNPQNPGDAPTLVGTCKKYTIIRLKVLSLAKFEHQSKKFTTLFNNGTMCIKIFYDCKKYNSKKIHNSKFI